MLISIMFFYLNKCEKNCNNKEKVALSIANWSTNKLILSHMYTQHCRYLDIMHLFLAYSG